MLLLFKFATEPQNIVPSGKKKCHLRLKKAIDTCSNDAVSARGKPPHKTPPGSGGTTWGTGLVRSWCMALVQSDWDAQPSEGENRGNVQTYAQDPPHKLADSRDTNWQTLAAAPALRWRSLLAYLARRYGLRRHRQASVIHWDQR